MNMKKTLAGLMAGVVAISAMATVAVSAKAQKADSVTWSTMAAPTKSAESIVYVTITPALSDGTKPAFKANDTIKLEWNGNATSPTAKLEIDSITKITYRLDGSTSVDTEDLERMYDVNAAKDTITFLTDVSDASATVELAIKIKSDDVIAKNSIDPTATLATGGAAKASNVKKDADETKKGVLLNDLGAGNTDADNAAADHTIEWSNLNTDIGTHIGKVTEVPEEIADFLKDAKGATLEFTFEKKEFDTSSSDKTFESALDRYDWASGDMEAAISLRINNSKVLSVDMAEFDKDSFTAIYNWDEVMAKFQVGSTTGLINNMQLKINNEKLPEKDGKVIELRLASITAKIPEMAETEDDTMVEDFAAGESATVVEDTLPAATDAPAATEAPATTDAAANPETGNSAAALLAIPAALAAAAIVAKKRG